MDLSRLSGRVAVVTGAAGGIGSAVCEELVQAGMLVAGVDVNAQGLQDLAQRLDAQPGKLHPIVGDISNEDDLERVFQTVQDTLGGVSVLMNNAGVVGSGLLDELTYAQIHKVVHVNLLGMMAASGKAIKSMKQHQIKDGHIINVSSVLGHPASVTRTTLGLWPLTTYCSTKHAVTGLSQALRAELCGLQEQGYHTRVTNLSPGFVKTPLTIGFEAGNLKMLQTMDIVRAVRFVLSSPPEVEITELTIRPTGEVM